MPETSLVLRWPDGDLQRVYSPSLVVHEHLPPGAYEVTDLLARTRTAMAVASARVQEIYGFPCTRAAASLASVEAAAARHPSATVEVLA